MTCPTETDFVAFLSGGLDDDRAKAIEAHIDGCNRCVRRWAELAEPEPTVPGTSRALGDGTAILPEGTRLGRYVVQHVVGAGAMGVVYAGHDPDLDRRVALKVVLPSKAADPVARDRAHSRLTREAQALAKLDHPNVVAVYDVGSLGGRVFVAMAFVEGKTLAAWLAETKRSWREVVECFVAAGRGLAAAHRAGLIHRDFKPANVLIDAQGVPQVVDFGLVRPTTDDTGPSPPIRTTDVGGSGSVTETGTVLGTPAYMAPEQFAGTTVDARADQFAFCVALWEALYGSRPFRGRSPSVLAAAVTEGRIIAPEPGHGVPRWIRPLLERGLATDAASRWPSMQALLRALEGRLRRGRRSAVWFALPVVAAGAAAFSYWLATDAPCAADPSFEQDVWGPTARARVRAAFEGSGAELAAIRLSAAEERLDAYAEHWQAMKRGACLAHEAGEQTAVVHDLRDACLGRRRIELTALIESFTAADAATVANAPGAVAGLVPLEVCADVERLRADVSQPEDPALAAQVNEARAALARAVTALAVGHYEEALELSEAVVAEARQIGVPGVLAECLLQLGAAQSQLGHQDAAVTTLEAAAEAAARAGSAETEADVWLELAWIVGIEQTKYARGESLLSAARAAVMRGPAAPRRRASLALVEAVFARHRGDLDRAEQFAEEALSLHNDIGENADLPKVLLEMSTLAHERGDLDVARSFLKRAREVAQRVHGEGHPTLAFMEARLALIAAEAGDFDTAVAQFERALQIREAHLPPDHPDIATTLGNLASAHVRAGDLDRAAAHANRAMQMRLRTLGPTHAEVGESHQMLGALALYRGQWESAVEHLEAALRIRRAAVGSDHGSLVMELKQLGSAQTRLRRLSEARSTWKEAQRIGIASGADASTLGTIDCSLAGLEILEGRPASAVDLAEQGLQKVLSANGHSFDRGICRFALARAVHSKDESRALALANEAIADLRETPKIAAVSIAEVEAWLEGT